MTLAVARIAFPVAARRPRPAVLDPVVRAAIMTDLALGEVLIRTSTDEVALRDRRIDFAPAARFIEIIRAHPYDTMHSWLFDTPVGTDDVARVMIARGIWAQRRGPSGHFTDLQPIGRTRMITELVRPRSRSQFTPTEAAIVALASVLPLSRAGESFRRPANSSRFGAAAWLVPSLVDSLERYRQSTRAMLTGAGRQWAG